MPNVIATVGADVIIENVKIHIHENDIVKGLVYKTPSGEKTIDGRIRVINVSTRAYNGGPTTCPPDPFFFDVGKVLSLYIDYSEEYVAKIITIPVEDIILIESVNDVKYSDEVNLNDPDTPAFADVIAAAADDTIIRVSEGQVDEEIVIDKGLVFLGANSGVAQNFKQEV